MTASLAVPQFRLERAASATGLTELRARRKAAGSVATVSDFLIAACARGLRDHRGLNASFDDEGIILRAGIHIGVAVATDAGLMVPAILDAADRSLEEVAAERLRLTDAAHRGRLTPAEVFSTTFTLSNLGPLGIERFTALVSPPQAAILAVGSADGRLTLGLSCDHRVVDGAPAARFLTDVAESLENPDWMEML
jgi:pyruvate dehydrogenase E2 component (dihydrolipoamide acetyltransferase)